MISGKHWLSVLGMASVVFGCSSENERQYRGAIEATCSKVAIEHLNSGRWALGPRQSEYLIDMAAIQRTYVESGRDTPVEAVVRRFAPAYLDECKDWIAGRGLVEHCKDVPFGTPEGWACWREFFNLRPGNDMDWVLRLAKFDSKDINLVTRGSWLRASREIDICGSEGCSQK